MIILIKKTFLTLIILLLIPISTSFAYDDGIDSNIIIEEQLDNLKLEELKSIISKVDESSREYLPSMNFKELLTSLIKGEEVISANEILEGIFKMIFKEVLNNSMILVQILVLSIMLGVLTNLQSAFEKDTVGKLAFYVCYLVLIAVTIKGFIGAVNIGRKAIEDMVIFIQALLPTLITLLLAMGGFASSALFQPVILGAVSAISTLMKDILFPLIFFSSIIGIVSKISEKVQITKLSGLLRQVATGIIGISLTIFIGVMSIQGATAAKVDGITIKTAKFAVDKFVPIVGKFLSDAMDTVVGASMLLKNAVGVIGLLVLFIICIMPIIKILSILFIYKLTAAVIEPISSSKVVDSLNEISKSLVLILSILVAVGMMFFIGITIVIGAGNITVMLR